MGVHWFRKCLFKVSKLYVVSITIRTHFKGHLHWLYTTKSDYRFVKSL